MFTTLTIVATNAFLPPCIHVRVGRMPRAKQPPVPHKTPTAGEKQLKGTFNSRLLIIHFTICEESILLF